MSSGPEVGVGTDSGESQLAMAALIAVECLAVNAVAVSELPELVA